LELAFNENLDLSGHEEHFIGITECNKANICFGIDIGDITRIKTSLYKTNKKYLITKEQLKKGITVNINVSNIMDIDFFDDDLKEKMKIYDLLNN